MIRTAIVLALLGALLLLAGPLGSRVGLWPFVVGFVMLAVSVLLGLVGASLALVGGLKTGEWALAAVGIVAGLAVVSVPSMVVLSARGVPPIHDITTDTENPPAFVAILPLRANAPNLPEYAGGDVAAQQRRAYPDIQPIILPVDARTAFDRALAAARESGWEIVSSDAASGRIEAVDTTFWFGFKDDVVIRMSEAGAGEGTRIDMRSKSRVGLSDVGTNARRIRDFLVRVRESP